MVNAFESFPNLLSPIKIGSVAFRNRMFVSPMGHTDIMSTGQPSMDALMFMERKAMGGFATVACGEVNVDPEDFSEGRWPRDIMKRQNYNYPRLASKIARHGAVPVMELQFAAMKARARQPGNKTPAWGPVDMDDYDGVKVVAMTEERFAQVIEGYGKAALAAKNAGFGMVTLHGAHGWGLQQFYSPTTNTRTDRWGGSTENRCRFPVMVIDEIHRVCGSDFPVEIRIGGTEVTKPGYDVDEACRIAEQLDGHADIILLSVGSIFHSNESFARTHVSMFYPQGRNVEYAAAVKKVVKKSLVGAVGALCDPFYMEEIIASGQADILYMGRTSMAEPDFPNKVRSGKVEDIRKCTRCMACFTTCMSWGDMQCSINPETGRERENYYSLPAAQKQKVLVIGGGIAGMEAALTASKNGHEVILCEKGDRLGGVMLCEADVPFKADQNYYIRQQIYFISKADIEVRLNTEVTPEYAKQEKPDVIIAAIGSAPVKLELPGACKANVHHAIDVYKDPALAKGKVVIIGAGFVGAEMAIYLNGLGHEVEVIEKGEGIKTDGFEQHKNAIEDIINQKNLPFHYKTTAVEITDKGVRCEGPDGEVTYAADTVIYAVGMSALQDDALAFYACAPTFHMIGDCRKVGNIFRATSTAYTTAKYIGRYDAV